jgi:hypothetical protein
MRNRHRLSMITGYLEDTLPDIAEDAATSCVFQPAR